MTEKSIIEQNTKIYHSKDLHTVRRKKLAVKDENWMKTLLKRGAFGILATECQGQPFINVHNYVYDEENNCIYFHRNKVGRTSANLQFNPRVCYSVVEMGRLYAGKKVCDFGVEYRSVVIFGVAKPVGVEEASRALRMIMEKYAPHLKAGEDYEPIQPSCAETAAVYRVDIERWSGKKSEVSEDHPFAYTFKSP